MKIYGTANGCARCRMVFGSLQMFDRHQVVDYSRRPVVSCRTPESLGLVLDGHGTWQTPEGLISRARGARMMARRWMR